jgi:hypothetical protein
MQLLFMAMMYDVMKTVQMFCHHEEQAGLEHDKIPLLPYNQRLCLHIQKSHQFSGQLFFMLI